MGAYEVKEEKYIEIPNTFITAKYDATLLESQVLAIALDKYMMNKSENPKVKLFSVELRTLVKDSAHIYRNLKVVASEITKRRMFYIDSEERIHFSFMVDEASYENGMLELVLNNETLKYLCSGTERKTRFPLSTIMKCKKNATLRLYEILKKQSKDIEENGSLEIGYKISEIQFILGHVSNNALNKLYQKSSGTLDLDLFYNQLDRSEIKYDNWRDFQKKVLKPAQEELGQKGEISFDYKGIRKGRKTANILFTIYKNNEMEGEKSS